MTSPRRSARACAAAAALLSALAACATPEERMARKASSLLAQGGGREGTVLLDCSPGDAEVLVDGVPQGRCDDFGGGRALKVGAGAHELEVRKPGLRSYRSVVSPGGARVGLEVKLPEGGTP